MGIERKPLRRQIEKPIAIACLRSGARLHRPCFLRQCFAISAETHALAAFDATS